RDRGIAHVFGGLAGGWLTRLCEIGTGNQVREQQREVFYQRAWAGQAVCEIKAQCSFVEHEGLEIGRGERKRHMHCQVIKAQVPISWLFSRRRTSFLPIGAK